MKQKPRKKAPVWTGARMFDTHFPVLSAKKKNDGGIEATKPLIYGTAFPILNQRVFVTAGHVLKSALADGTPCLGHLPEDGSTIKASSFDDWELFDAYDLALLVCEGVAKAPAISLEFDRDLTLMDPVWSVGFPEVDPERITVIPRAFRGHVVTRREHYGLPGQPPCYEVSFPAPEGLSGAPLMMPIPLQGGLPPIHRCLGYMIQQATLGRPDRQIAVGVAVDIKVLLTIETKLLNLGSLPKVFKKPPFAFKPTEIKLPGGMKPIDASVDNWPDEPPTEGQLE
jgi:hypothetical protein